jgi:gamma-glutamylcyclotransferase (GGCT)/AIG2-like uncharacterized protein YtfP
MDHTVAVYGSLKRNYGNHHVMSRASGRFISNAISTDSHYILDGHGFPYINESPSDPLSGHLAVELYSVPNSGLTGPLDSLEGHPTFYQRQLRSFLLPSGETTKAWVYIYQRPITPNPKYKLGDTYTW